jgi:hypothetical protein
LEPFDHIAKYATFGRSDGNHVIEQRQTLVAMYSSNSKGNIAPAKKSTESKCWMQSYLAAPEETLEIFDLEISV